MRIAIASLQQESNSLTPLNSHERDFDLARGTDMYKKVHVMHLLEEAGAEVVPTLYAHALPGGPLEKSCFLHMAGEIIEGIPPDVDGIWLYLHGALFVRELGSGETYLLRRIREKVGFNIPISAALDFHANNTDEFISLCNVICGFRTAPHRDQIETECKAMRLLLHCIRNRLLPKPQMARANVIVPGDCVQTGIPPLAEIMAKADEIEEAPGILCAQVFNGQPWVDTPYTGPSMVVTHEHDEGLAKQYAAILARMFYEARGDFHFLVEALKPGEAIRRALEAPEETVFLSDSGDNTTAGASGDNAFLLNRLLQGGVQNALLAGIADAEACGLCYKANIGDTLTLKVGGSLDSKSETAIITGILRRRGDVLGYTGDNGGPSALIECRGITVIITQRRAAFTSPEIFRSARVDPLRYKLVVVKLGYLFPPLAAIAPRTILVLSPGSSTEHLADMGHQHIRRPMYPLDEDFEINLRAASPNQRFVESSVRGGIKPDFRIT
jgi:microcystin degradation protein MlrC